FLLSGLRDSGNTRQTNKRVTRDKADVVKKGRRMDTSPNTPPTKGPKMAPRPKAAPKRPMPLARSSSDVVSEMTAMAVGKVAEDKIPAKVRAINKKGVDGANAKRVIETA